MSAKDKVRAKAEQTKGLIKETAGRMTGDRRMEAQGRYERARGDLRDVMEKARQGFRKKHK
ncbi:CsbD family protein [Streptomyces sp. NPDC037389]|uniref:CsbD family protein n=1 Tax=Streptomyces sp. NPDC037389 TaxID=3155369 RepID=UPI0033CA4AF3